MVMPNVQDRTLIRRGELLFIESLVELRVKLKLGRSLQQAYGPSACKGTSACDSQYSTWMPYIW
jgi:hypothetical protein